MKTTAYPSKYALPKEIFTVGKTRFKWYDLAKDPAEVSSQDIQNAKMCIENANENFQNIEDLGFVIMHRCGENYLLLICTWRSENELWESVYYDGTGKFEIWNRNKTHLPTYCVWEMGIVSMNLRHGKNTWELQGRRVIRWNILMTCLRVKCRSKEVGSYVQPFN